MPIACPSCGTENPDGFNFCGKCRASLAAPLPVSEERKVVTTLFCDLVNFTSMSEAADPEDVDRILGEYFARATKVIESHGGTVEKFIGDAVVGVFGVPAVHEDDPERAVRAALRILEALEGMTRPDGSPLQARCGVNTGEALVRLDVDPASGRGCLTGDAVNVAARLEAAAPPGGVAVGSLTHALTGRVINHEPLAPVEAKGKAEPVEAWRAVSPVARTGTRIDCSLLTPLVGRETELTHLTAALEAAISVDPQFVLLVGEPGIGKSRLVQELFAHVDSRPEMIVWRQGRCRSYGESAAFSALAEIVKAHAGILESDDAASVEAKLEDVLPESEDRPWFRQRLRALLGLDAPKAEREENFAAWLRFLEVIATRDPTVLIIEDLHWADAALLDFLGFLAAHASRVSLMVVTTARTELLEDNPSFAGGDRFDRIDLEPLSPEETEQLVSSILDESEASLRTTIALQAQGNPFYAEESARLVCEESGKRRASLLPGSVQAVIAARLDALPVDVKAVLSDAAVAGDVFWDGLLLALGDSSEQAVHGALDELMGKRLVNRSRGSLMAGEREYAFAHALTREVAYRQTARPSRASRHAAAAAWLEQKLGDRAEEMAEVIVSHYEAAYAAALALADGERAEELRSSLVHSLVRATKRVEFIDVAAFRRWCARGLELAQADSPERARLQRYWAEVLTVENRYREATDTLKEVIPALLEQGDKRSAARAMGQLAGNRAFMGEPAFDLWVESVRLLDDDGPSKELIVLLHSLAGATSMREGSTPEQVIEIAQRALDMNDALGLSLSGGPLSWRGSARLDTGDLGGLDDYHQALEDAKKQGLSDDVAMILFNGSTVEFAIHGTASALEMQLECLEFSERHGIDYFSLAARAILVETYANLGHWSRAMQQAAEVIPELERVEDVIDMLLVRSHLLLLLSRTGRVHESAGWIDWLEATGCDTETSFLKMYAMLAVAEARCSMGQRNRALGLLEQWSALPAFHSEPASAAFVPGAVRAALECRQLELAERLIASVEPNLPLRECVRLAGDGCLALGREDGAAALDCFARAGAGWHRLGVPYEEGHALFGQGRGLATLGRAREAAQPLEQARGIFERLGAKPALVETEVWLAKTQG